MTESKIISFRIKTDFYEDFVDFCTRNKISKKEAFVKAFELVLEADKGENYNEEKG